MSHTADPLDCDDSLMGGKLRIYGKNKVQNDETIFT
jgi:hypothetical protein